MKLYHNIISQPARVVEAILVAGKIEHELIHIDFAKGEHKSEQVLALNPRG